MIKDENSALNKAKEEGIKEGMQKGIKEGVYKVAKSLKEAGVTTEIIQNTTGLAQQEIENL